MAERWRPESIGELQSFIDNALADETHSIEFKERPPSNKSIAKQLAGFAIDGGELIIGVAEPEPGTFAIKPLAHAGLPEKVDQIAQARVDRPLLVESRLLREDDNAARGVLWVSVPPSPEAPHQVDGTYYKRAGKQTLPMSDPEVERLIWSRRTTLEGIESALREAMAKDTAGELPHIIGVARPTGAARDELYDAVGGRAGWGTFGQEVANAIEFQLQDASFGPSRYTLRNYHLNDRARISEGSYRELSLGYDGELKWLSEDGGFVDTQFDPNGVRRLLPESVVRAYLGLVRAMLTVATTTGRHRSWDVGIGVNRTRGLKGSL